MKLQGKIQRKKLPSWGLHGMMTLEHTGKHTVSNSKQQCLTRNLLCRYDEEVLPHPSPNYQIILISGRQAGWNISRLLV